MFEIKEMIFRAVIHREEGDASTTGTEKKEDQKKDDCGCCNEDDEMTKKLKALIEQQKTINTGTR